MSDHFQHEANSAFNTFCQEQLNKEQHDIVMRHDGVMVIHAGAGSGKTRVITARIVSLILNKNINPHSIIALTFTNKAAREMKERVAKFLGGRIAVPFLGTFHSYCVRLLRTNKMLLETPEFTIIDKDDQEKLLKNIINRHGLQKQVTARGISAIISRLKNDSPQGAIEYEKIADTITRDIVLLYEKEKKASQCLDFDDLLGETLRLFKKFPEIKARHQAKVRHVLVDEFQDTNYVQHSLLKEIISDDQAASFVLDSLCVVGDEDQSIYSWRGAIPNTMIDFKKTFPMSFSLTLDQNYRSAQSILDCANQLIKQNSKRAEKKLWSARHKNDCLRLVTCSSGYQEAEMAAELIQHHMQIGQSLKDCAVLYRSHYQTRLLEESLVRRSIPYIIIGGIQFYDRQEVKDLLAYFKLSVNPHDRISFERAINTPNRSLGDKFQELFAAHWVKKPALDFKQVAALIVEERLISESKRDALNSFVAIFSAIDVFEKPSAALEYIIGKTEYMNYLKNSCQSAEETRERQGNVKELLNALRARETTDQVTIGTFLEEIALLQEARTLPAEDRDCVNLMTLHGAKGLEFGTVIITGLEEGTLPSSHSSLNPDMVEEERRLLYVGITRAQDRLLLTHARYRYIYGRMVDQCPSRFIQEFKNMRVLRYEDVSAWHAARIKSYCEQWIGYGPKSHFGQVSAFDKSKKSFAGTLFFDDLEADASALRNVSGEDFGVDNNLPMEKDSPDCDIIEDCAFDVDQNNHSPNVFTGCNVSDKSGLREKKTIIHRSFGSVQIDDVDSNAKIITGAKKKNSRFVSFVKTPVGRPKGTIVSSDQKKEILNPDERSVWHINQKVEHARFGLGVIHQIERRGMAENLTICFGDGIKKINANFVKPV